MRRIRLPFAGLEVEFTDREKALSQVQEWAGKGTWQPIVVYGPEGCGKTSWLRQAAELLRENGYARARCSSTPQLSQEQFS
jgi:predicted AAA+ superfamily ATPase